MLSEDKCRLSLSGWFHGPSIERPARHIEEPLPRSPHLPRDVSSNTNVYIFIHSVHSYIVVSFFPKARSLLFLFFLQETLLLEWVNPMYLDISYQEQIQEEFEESSEIQLKDFFKVCLLSSRFSF